MREIKANDITQAVAWLCQQSNFELGEDVLSALEAARKVEQSPLGRDTLDKIIENARIAAEEKLPLCQDCGTAVVFLQLGQEVHIAGGDLYTAVAKGVSQGYAKGFLRKSMVKNPFTSRANTGDNTPPVVHTEIVPGSQLRVTVMPKGGGAENMSRLAMLKPAAGRQGVVDLAVETVNQAGGNPCPPLIVGLGIGGTAEKAMLLAKQALLRPVGQPSPDPETAGLEEDVLAAVNALGIGPLGIGGTITALAVHAEVVPAHIASLPVAVNLQCHSDRHREILI
jgi:fumarate hydratase subunit alpha